MEAEYIVVGAGTAGCIVASRLAALGHSVLLFEAGGSYRRILDIPLLGMWAWLRSPRDYTWMYRSIPQPGLNGRSIPFYAAKLVGGGSAINAMIYSRGHPASYDRWGAAGWTYRDLLPYMRRAEANDRFDLSEYHGAQGPLAVSTSRFVHPLGLAFVEGCRELGIAAVDDLNGATAEGAGFYQLTQAQGRRCSTARAYLRGGREPVTVLRTDVRRIVLERGRAVGISYISQGREQTVRALREVILCAGVVGSPQLLLRSGIGPAADLRRAGIPVVADLPGVGANLRDPVRVPLPYRVHGRGYSRWPALVSAALEYARHRTGLLTSNVSDAGAILRSSEHAPFPDIRVVFSWRALPAEPGMHVAFEAGLMDPDSCGAIRLRPEDPWGEPLIDPGYLMADTDVTRLRAAMDWARRIAAADACRAAGIGPEAGETGGDMRNQALSAHHPVGTCRLGTDDGAVVDRDLRVRGIEALRVVDASVMPRPVAGNALAAVVAIAERGASLLLC